MSIQENVQKWLDIDNRIKEQNEIIKRLRNERSGIEENITNYANTNNLNNLSIKTDEGILKLFDLKTSSPCITPAASGDKNGAHRYTGTLLRSAADCSVNVCA